MYRPELETLDAGAPDRGVEITLLFAAPLKTDVGSVVVLSGAATNADGRPVKLHWTAFNGVISDPKAADTTYTCTLRGKDTVTLLASDGMGLRTQSVDVTCM